MSLEIEKNIADTITVKVSGRLDTFSSPEMEKVFDELIPMKKAISVDLLGLDYISSAGLRVILMAQKKMNANGEVLKFSNVNEIIRGIFETTGFNDILTIE